MVVTSVLCLSHNVFRSPVPTGCENLGFYGKVFTLSQTTNSRLFQIERVCRGQNKCK